MCLTDVVHQDIARLANVPVLRLGETGFSARSAVLLTAFSENEEAWTQLITTVGGATTIHQHSAIWFNSSIVLVIGPFLVCLNTVDGRLEWQTRCDRATCFGVHIAPDKSALIVHGELAITRVTLDGRESWKAGGRDIFTGSFMMHRDGLQVTDFNGEVYRINLETGHSTILDE